MSNINAVTITPLWTDAEGIVHATRIQAQNQLPNGNLKCKFEFIAYHPSTPDTITMEAYDKFTYGDLTFKTTVGSKAMGSAERTDMALRLYHETPATVLEPIFTDIVFSQTGLNTSVLGSNSASEVATLIQHVLGGEFILAALAGESAPL